MARPAEVLTVGGIDPNSHKIVIVETMKSNKVKPFIHMSNLGEASIEKRLSAAFDFVVDFSINVYERDGVYPHLYLEAPVMGVGGPGSTIPQAFVSGAIMTGAVQGGAVIKLVNNTTWKKKVIGNGNSNKLAISKWVEENWSALYSKAPIITNQAQGKELKGRGDQDVIDAGCIALFGWKNIALIESIKTRRSRG